MSAVKRNYEVTIVVSAGKARADLDGTLAAVRGIFETEGAEWIELTHEKLGERKLAYPIKGETVGLYLEGYFAADPASIDGIERRCELSEEVLRHIVLARDGKSYDQIRDQRAKREARQAEAAAAAAAATAE